MKFIEYYAKWFGRIAHTYIGQKRKYTGEWYFSHTEAVHDIVMAHGGTPEQGAAAYLHDYREDVVTWLKARNKTIVLFVFEWFYNLFPASVRKLVNELTDVYTSENYPQTKRAIRKSFEAGRIAKISNEAKLIKLADLFHNTESIVSQDEKFAIVYLKEKFVIMKGLHGSGSPELYAKVENQLKESIDKLKVIV